MAHYCASAKAGTLFAQLACARRNELRSQRLCPLEKALRSLSL
jgi:hypothetical protein